jgi:hypothetical protein
MWRFPSQFKPHAVCHDIRALGFTLARADVVTLRVYDTSGRVVPHSSTTPGARPASTS